MTRDLKAGDTISGRYSIIRPLSVGGMGAVYLAEQTSLGREVAIKVILESVKDSETLERFDLEARAVCRMRHPNIITYHDYGRDGDGNPYIVMEFLPGFPASQLFSAAEGATLEVLVHVASQMCSALAEAHRAGIVHRDLKWTNIMICPQAHDPYFAKLIDFGIVKMSAEQALKKGITQTGMLLGTPQYMPPEAIQGLGVDGRADQYSLAVMLWEGIEGRKPFDANSMFEVFRMHVQDRAPDFVHGKTILDIYPGFEAAIMRAMSKHPADRFPTILDFQRALHRAMGLPEPTGSHEMARTPLRGDTGFELPAASQEERGDMGLHALQTRLRTQAGPARGRIPKWALAVMGLGLALAAAAAVLVVADGGEDDRAAAVVAETTRSGTATPLKGAEANDSINLHAPEVTAPPPLDIEPPEEPAPALAAAVADEARDHSFVAVAGAAERLAEDAVPSEAETPEAVTAVSEPKSDQAEAEEPLEQAETLEDTAAETASKTRKLVVTVRPWGNVSVNGSVSKQAPYIGVLPTDKVYRIIATHPTLGQVKRFVTLKPNPLGKAMTVSLSFGD